MTDGTTVAVAAAGGTGGKGIRGTKEDMRMYMCEYPVHVQSEWRSGRELQQQEEEMQTARQVDFFCGALRWGLTRA